MFQHQRVWQWMGMAGLLIMVAGCSLGGPRPDIVSEEKKEGQAYSAAEVRRMNIDHPWLLSGDYFLNREYPAEKASDEEPADREQLEARVQQLEKQVGEEKPSPSDSESPAGTVASAKDKTPPVKIGFYLDVPESAGKRGASLVKAAGEAAAGAETLRLVNHYSIRDILASADCRAADDYDCMARNLALYPGVRMLVVAEQMQIPDQLPGEAALRLKVLDADLVSGYPKMEMTRRLEDRAAVPAFLQEAVRRAFAYAKNKAEIMPPHCRVFSVKNQRAYISAGKRSGLAPGDVLRVVSGGETVKSPTGLLVGWLPGEETGTLKVQALVGKDVAACAPVSGEMPEKGSYVLFSAPSGDRMEN